MKALGILALLSICSFAETVKDRAGAVLGDREKMQQDTRWIYNDWRRGFEEARRTGKPLLVVLRCVPCLACMGIDATVLSSDELKPVLNEFVLARVINANDLDLSLFQFDYDLSFSALFFNGDGTIYGRYGSWTHQKNSRDTTIEGFKRGMQSALEIHRGYPTNKEHLRGKQGRPLPVKDPLELPELAGKYTRNLDWEGKVVQSCVHCHQIGDGIRSNYRNSGQKIPRQWIYPLPMPETIGLTLSAQHAATVESVLPDSIAAKAGLRPGDEFVSFEGQPLISVADLSWVLHHAPESGSVSARVRRGDEKIDIKLDLPKDWRLKSDISRRVGTWPMRAMALGGLVLEELPPAERARHSLADSSMALLVKHAGEYGKHAAAKKAGFQKGDILIELGGQNGRTTESELIGHLLETSRPGEKIDATVLRGAERIELKLPMQ